jgi:hypothetical protein
MSEPRLSYRIDLPPDLNLAIMVLLSFHLGRKNPISRTDLCAALHELNIHERRLRDQIRHLRRSGHLIGESRGSSEHPERSGAKSKDLGEKGGYYLITTPEELDDFLRTEYLAKINDMQETVKEMTKAASQRWGPDAVQIRLF